MIAETRDLPVRYIKSVVTDDQGRYVIPDLPKANYDVWVRGYGLVDSPKVKSEPGKQLNLTAVLAPNEAEAAKYYPAIYWYSMMKIPEAEFFGSKDAPPNVKITDYLNGMKNNGCVGCHQLGQLSTRTIPKFHLKAGKTHEEAWVRRTQSGQAGENMTTIAAGQLGGVPYKYLGDWTERVAKGELPFAKPTRPQGVERNIVVTLRDWHNDKQYLHDLIASDRRYPTVNAYGPVYGSVRARLQRHADPRSGEERRDELRAADHGRHAAGARARQRRLGQDSRTLGLLGRGEHLGLQRPTTTTRCSTGRAASGSPRPATSRTTRTFCKKGSSHPSAVEFPLNSTNRRVTMYDPKTGKYTAYQTCFGSHHLQFGYDANETLWMSTGGGGGNVGWINTKMLDETGDIEKSQGWTALVLDTNGNGQRDEYTEPGKPQEPGKDMRIGATFYAVMPSPTDGSVWGTLARQPGRDRPHRSDQEPAQVAGRTSTTCRCRASVRAAATSTSRAASGSRSRAATWACSTAACARARSTARRRPAITAPRAGRSTSIPARASRASARTAPRSSYYSWVDQHNTFGLGDDIPMSTANLMDGLVALNKDGKMVSIRVPYPLGFYAKGFDGRIDDPNAGWKGRGLWAANGDRTPWLIEGGKGTKPLAAHFQLRPDPLAH